MRQIKSKELSETNNTILQWLSVALLAQLGWGAYPVLLRYLQTISGLPSLSLLAMGNLGVLLITAVTILPRLDKRIFRSPIVWLFGLVVVLRAVSNLLAVRFTLAIYAQLIYLMTPFMVAFFSRAILKEHLPRNTIKALVLAFIGALLIVSKNVGQSAVVTPTTQNNLIGISLALASTIFLSIYMILTRHATNQKAPGEALLVVHLISLFSFSMVASLIIGEDWNRWGSLSGGDWFVFGFLSVGVLLGANLGQIRSIQFLGAPLTSSIMPIRLVSALIVGGLLLGERLTSAWQVVGAAVVILTLTWYLRQQYESPVTSS